jgi:hypothetical protein
MKVFYRGNVLLTNTLKTITAAALLFTVGTFGQEADRTNMRPERSVKGRTIVSQELPKAVLTIAKGFRFVGTQRVNLYGNADAEQYVFVKPGPNKVVNQFYWIQFEHFLPTNNRTYSYDAKRTVEIGNLPFVYDVKSWPDYAAMQMDDPASDGAAIERLLAKHNLSFSRRVVRVRMFNLPSADHRSELMIIYGETLPEHSEVPVREGGVELDTESPASAQMFLDHARQGLVVQTQ